MAQVKTQLAIKQGWTRSGPARKLNPLKPELSSSQLRAFLALRIAIHIILNAPTGWGKSVLIASITLYRLLLNKNLRCIISVPQTVIGEGFVRDWQLKISGKLISWIVGTDLCGDDGNKTDSVIQFLKTRHSFLGGRILLCPHATLTSTFRQLKRQKKLDLFANTLVWIDEGHHVMNAQLTGGGTQTNSIGGLVRHLVLHPELKAQVALATATFMRGDMRHILSDDLIKKFKRHDIAYDEYFETEAPVESFEFNIMCAHYLDAVGSLFKKQMCRTIIYLAKRQSAYATDCKIREVKQIVSRIAKSLKGVVKRDGDLYIIKTATREIRILDLVSEDNRRWKKRFLANGGEVDIIIALDMCKEGFDWVLAERSIIIGERHSIPEMIQMMGRLFRKSSGKRHVGVYQILPAIINNRKKFKESRNYNLTAIFAAMLLEEVYAPIAMSSYEVGRQRTNSKGRRLYEVVSNGEAWDRLMRDFIATCGTLHFDEALAHAPSLLSKHNIPKREHEWVFKSLWARCTMKSRESNGLYAKNIPFKLLKKESITDGIITLASGLCGKVTFNELRGALREAPKTPEQWVPIAEKLARDNAAGKLKVAA